MVGLTSTACSLVFPSGIFSNAVRVLTYSSLGRPSSFVQDFGKYFHYAVVQGNPKIKMYMRTFQP